MFAALKQKVTRSQPTSARESEPGTARSDEASLGTARSEASLGVSSQSSPIALAGEGSPPVAGGAAALRRSRRSSGSASAPQLAPLRSATPERHRPAESPPLSTRSADTLDGHREARARAASPAAVPRMAWGGAAAKEAAPAASPPRLPRNTLEGARAAGHGPSASPESSPAESPSASPGTTPRTPRMLEVSVEGQEASTPAGAWLPDGSLEAPANKSCCTVTVKAGLAGKSGMHVVLRVGLAAQEDRLRFSRSSEGLSTWATVKVSGAEECDIGRLPSRSNGSPRVPKPGVCQHSWSESETFVPGAGCGPQVDTEAALDLDASSCRADFRCRLALRVNATCVVQQGGQATLRVEVEGEMSLLPRFCLVGREAVVSIYRAARSSYCAGDALKAMQGCEQALTIANTLTPRPRETGDALNLLGALHLRRNSPGLAVKCLERALAIRTHHASGPGDVTLAGTLSTLGSAHQTLGSHAEAQRCHQRAVAVLEKASDLDGSVLATALHNLGSAHRALGRHEEARQCYERALALRERIFGAEHALNAATLNNLGAVLHQLTRCREAVPVYQKALAIQNKTYGREHPATAATLSNLGSAHGQLGEHRLAVDCHGRALVIQEKHVGGEHPDVAATMHNLGNALAGAGRGHDAARCHWRALGIWSRTLGPAHPDIAATLHSLGNVYRGLREPEAAAQCFAGALRIREVTLGPTHTETARTRHCAALVGCTLGDHPAAAQELQAAVNSLISGLGSRHPWSLQARADLESLRQVMAS